MSKNKNKKVNPEYIMNCVMNQGDRAILDLFDTLWGESIYERTIEELEERPIEELEAIYDEFCKEASMDEKK